MNIFTDAKHLELLKKVLDGLNYEVKDIGALSKDNSLEGLILLFGASWLDRSKTLAKWYNLGYVDIALIVGLWNDKFNQTQDPNMTNFGRLQTFVINSIERTTYIKESYINTGIYNAIKIQMQTEYLYNCNESITVVNGLLASDEKRLYIQASAGTGKTTAILEYYKQMKLCSDSKYLVFAVPTIEIMKQTIIA